MADKRASMVVIKWRAAWEARYGRQPPKLTGTDRTKASKLATRIPAADLALGIEAFLADDWWERHAHGLGMFIKHADKYVEQAKRKRGGGCGKREAIIRAGDEQHEDECRQWRGRGGC